MRQAVRLKNTDRSQAVTVRLDGPFAKDGSSPTLTILAGETVSVDAAVLRCDDLARRLKPHGPIKSLGTYIPTPADPQPLFYLG